MSTVASRGSSIAATVLTTWASTTNAYDGTVGTNNATYATYVNAARSTAGSITIGGYSFGGLTGTINSVSANIRHIESSTSVISNVTVQLLDSSGAAIGSAVAATRTTAAHTDTLTLGTPTLAQVNAGLQVIVTVTRSNSTTSTTFSLDYVDITVDYTLPPTPTGSVVAQGQYAADKRTPITTGSSTGTDGYTTDLYLNFLVSNTNDQTYDNFPGVEIKPVGTSFTGTANYTANSFIAQESAEPSAMRGSVMAYDSVNKRFIMTGGYDGTSRFNDVWELDASGLAGKWKKLSPTGTGPAGKNLGGATMINQNGKAWFVYWGGNTGSDSNDLTILDCTTRGSEVWTTVTQTSAPTARSYQTLHMAYVPLTSTTGELYYFGGWASTRENNLVKFSVNTASTVPTAVTWTTVSANGASGAPPGRSGCILYYDAAYNRLIVHGGYTTTGVSDTWAWSLSGLAWSQLSPTGTAPTGRELFAAAYDPTSQRLVVAGGWSTEVSTNNRNDIYQIDFSSSSNGVFTQLKTNDYPDCDIIPFSSAASAYDSDRRLFATSGINGYDGTDRYSYAFDFTETVAANAMTLYGMNIVDWQRARDAPAHCVDTDANEFLMINGFSGMADDTLAANSLNGDHMNEIWAFSPSSKNVRYANQGIFGMTYKEGVFACYDSIGKRVIAYGGLTGATQVTGGVWELKRDTFGNYKARKMFPSGTIPDPRWLMAGGFDAVNNRMIVWGGSNKSAMEDNSLHILDLSGGGDGVWSTVTAGGTTPPVVWQPWYDTDTVHNRLYVTSGATNFGASSFSTRTDYLNMSLTTPAWTNVNTTGVTGGRGGCIAYDPSVDALNAFGGYNGSVVTNTAWEMQLSSPTWTATSPTTSLPSARRSAAVWWDNTNDGMVISSGRPVSGQWYRDYTIYTPAYAYGIAGWFPFTTTVFEQDSVRVKGLTNNTSYHWQAISTILGTTFTGSYGGNSESAADFIVGTSGPSTYTRPHTTDSLRRKSSSRSHTTDSIARKQFSLVHTTSSAIRNSFTKTHTTDSNKKKSNLKTHTTDANKKKSGSTVAHTTDANKKLSGYTRTHTTDSFLRKQVIKTHTTDSLKKSSGLLRTHTTDSNKKKSGTTVNHTADAYKHLGAQTFTRIHSTDSNKKTSGLTRSHTTDSNKKTSGLTRSHTTDANKKIASLTRSHTADSLKRKQNTLIHTTSANKRITGFTVSHTTSSNKKVSGLTRSHSTDSFLRRQIAKIHTTDSVIRRANTRTHTTDSVVRKANTRSHSTDALRKIASITRFHTTDSLKRISGLTCSHTTSSNLKKASLTRTHTADAYKTYPLLETLTDNFNDNTVNTSLWSASDAGGLPFSRAAETNTRFEIELGSSATGVLDAADLGSVNYYSLVSSYIRAKVVSATGGANRYGDMIVLVTGGTSPRWSYSNGQLLAQTTPNGGTSRTTVATLTYNASTHLYWRIRESGGAFFWDTSPDGATWTQQATTTPVGFTSPIKTQVYFEGGATGSGGGSTFYFDDVNVGKITTTRAHSTDSLKRKQSTVSHTTDSLKKVSGLTRSHTTDANKKTALITRSHTTSSVIRKANTRSHSTDANKRLATIKSHTTDSLKRVQLTRVHTTDSLKRVQITKSHTTDSLKRKQNTLIHSTDSNKKKSGTTVFHTTSSNKKIVSLTKFHTTDANKKIAGIVRTHTTDSFKRIQSVKYHTTDALRKNAGLTRSHTADALKRAQNTRSHTTDSLKKTRSTLSHTTDARLAVLQFNDFSDNFNDGVTDTSKWAGTYTESGGNANYSNDGTTSTYIRTSQTRSLIGNSFFFKYGPYVATFVSQMFSLIDSGGVNQIVRVDHEEDNNLRLSNSSYSVLATWAYVSGYDWIRFGESGGTFTVDTATSPSAGWVNRYSGATPSGLSTAYFRAEVGFTGGGGGKGGYFGFIDDYNVNLPSYTRTHTTDSVKRKQTVATHSTDSVKRATNTRSHTTDSLKRISGITRSHTTDSLLRRQLTKTHTTDANKKKASLTRTHTTDANKKTASLTRSHTTDALRKIAAITRSHTTDANKRITGNVRVHSTDSLKRKQFTKTHTTDANRKLATVKSHTTDSNKKVTGFTRSHTTDAYRVVVLSQGARSPATSTNDASAGTLAWSNPGNILLSDDSYASASDINPGTTNYLKGTNFGFTIPSTATIRGIIVEIEKHASGNGVNYVQDGSVRIVKSTGAIGTTNKGDLVTKWGTTDSYYTYGSSSDLWGETWTYSDINSSNFGAAIQAAITPDTSVSAFVDHMRITVYYTTTIPSFTKTHSTGSFLRKQTIKTHTTDSYLSHPSFTKSHTADALKTTGTSSTTVTYAIGSSGDDAVETISTGAMNTTVQQPTISGLYHVGYRFTGIALPQGTVITSAKFTTENYQSGTDNFNGVFDGVTLKGQAADNPINFGVSAGDISARSVTTASATGDYSPFATGMWGGSTATGIDVTSIVQELLNRSGWVSGNAMVFLFKGTGTETDKIQVYHWDYFSGNQPTRLIITYGTTSARQMARPHTTDSYKHRTATLTHTTDSYKRLANVTRSHTTDSLKRITNTRSHTTDSLKRALQTRTHTTSSVLRKQVTKLHTTDSNLKKSGLTRVHSTDANKRLATIKSHTTDSLKRVAGLVRTHTTDSLKRKAIVVTHTTDSFLRRQLAKTHTTDAFKRTQNIKTHTTDANKKKSGLTVAHSTDTNKKRAALTVSHTTSASKRIAGNTRTHLTDALKRSLNVRTHTTDALKRTQTTKTHTTDSFLRKQLVRVHTTDANIKKSGLTKVHSTDANRKKANNVVTHTTDSLKRAQNIKVHTTDALKRVQRTLTHTTGSFLRRQITKTHTTDSFLRKQNTHFHTTDVNKKKANNTVVHSTDANKKRALLTVSHLTDALKRKVFNLSHTTNALVRKQIVKTHTTDSFKRTQNVVTHKTDSYVRSGVGIYHSTDANKRKSGFTVLHSTSANKRVAGLILTHTTSAFKRTQNVVSHATDAFKRVRVALNHTTDSFLRRQIAKTHTTDTLKRVQSVKFHTTDANKKHSANTVVHTTSANIKRAANTILHTTSANLKKASNTVSHLTDALKRTLNTKSHTTNALLRTQTVKTHSTNSFLRRQIAKTHTTSANLRKAFTHTHTADANLRKATTRTHTTDANRRKSGNVVSHVTDALKRKSNTVAHTTNTLLRKTSTKFHTTNSFLRRQITVTHTTSANLKKSGLTKSHTTGSFLRSGSGIFHATDANMRRANSVSHKTDASKFAPSSVSHLTDALLRLRSTISHTTSANKRRSAVVFQTADAFKRSRNAVSHTTSSALRKAYTVLHTTSANKRRANTVSHLTDANKKTINSVNHTTDASLKQRYAISQLTDSFLRKMQTVAHSTSANKKRGSSVSHKTDAVLSSVTHVSHRTDANLFAERGNKRVFINGQWTYGIVYVLDNGIWVVAPVYVYDGSTWTIISQ